MDKFQIRQLTEELRRELSLRVTPTNLLRFHLQILRAQFLDGKLGDGELYKWLEDEEETDVVIDIAEVNPERLVTAKPLILLKSGRVSFAPQLGGNVPFEIDYTNASRSFLKLVDGSISIMVISSNILESSDIAWEVRSIFAHWEPEFREHLALTSYNVSAVEEIGTIESSEGKYLIPININYSFTEGWKTIRESDTLSGIDQEVEVKTD